MKRSLLDHAILSLKGMAVGAVEFLPGISGGTIAFVVGIYQELLNTIKGALPAFKQLFGKKTFKQRITDFWIALNGNFIVALILGMLVAIVATISLVKYMLDLYPIVFYAFVFGLVMASVVLVYKKVSKWTATCYLLCLVGIGFALLLPVETIEATKSVAGVVESVPVWYFFICSMVASWAFILPGTSGTFVMVLMGGYATQVYTFHALDMTYIATFAIGCLTGLILFSHFLSWLLQKYHDKTVALLTGFIIGSLRVIWPWKKTVCEDVFTVDAYGVPWPKEVCITTGNTLPNEMIAEAAIAGVIGVVLVLGIEFIAKKLSKKTN
jgi:putative membrane protein